MAFSFVVFSSVVFSFLLLVALKTFRGVTVAIREFLGGGGGGGGRKKRKEKRKRKKEKTKKYQPLSRLRSPHPLNHFNHFKRKISPQMGMISNGTQKNGGVSSAW